MNFDGVKRIHLLGICGTGMGSFAGLLKSRDYLVTGSDENVYPPMSDKLAEWKIPVMSGYAAHNLDAATPDLVIVGNVIRLGNVEATAMRERGLRFASFPEALGALLDAENKHAVVVAGTHGKTTTTSLVAHLLMSAGREPSLLVGGVPANFGDGFRDGKGEHFVIEGDEYDTAYFDKGPKFLHYRPRTVLFTGAEFDHADIYRDLAHYESSFEKLFALLPADGYLAACASYANTAALARSARCEVETYAAGGPADWQTEGLVLDADGIAFVPEFRGAIAGQSVRVPMAGRHNAENALGAVAVAKHLGLTDAEIGEGLRTFLGVKRRQEVRGEARGVLVIDDFAHHPTAVRETIAALLSRYPGRRLWAVFEPRSNTAMRKVHQAEYPRAFAGAAAAVIVAPTALAKVPEDQRGDAAKMAADIAAAGTPSHFVQSPDEAVALVAREARAGDLVVGMSNGGFGGFHGKLLTALGGGQ